MTMRWMHPPELERQRDRGTFDPVAEGSRYRLSRELALAIWAHVCADVSDSAGRHDAAQAQRRFHELAARIAARGGRLRPDVGRVTRVEVEVTGVPLGAWSVDELAPRTPGRDTLAIAEVRRWDAQGEALAAGRVAEGRISRSELPGAGEVTRAMEALQEPRRRDQASRWRPTSSHG